MNDFEKAKLVIPGGVNSPVRAFASVGGDPVFIDSAAGAILKDVNGREYIDYVGSWGPMILGHAHPDVIATVQAASTRGLSFGAPTRVETELAERVCSLMPGIEKIRMVNSGTEATMSAIRLARGYTGRDKLIKFEGCYHGHSDSLLIKAGSAALSLGTPTSPGVPASLAEHTLSLKFNDLETVEQAFEKFSNEIACVIVEPVAGNMNCIPPVDGFLEGLRRLCDEHGSLLIFDEVMTGFRVALGGAQARYGVEPHLTTLGKIIGGGMPVGAFGGPSDIMNHMAPDGPVYQAGTLSGNPVAMHAGLKTLELIAQDGFHTKLDAATARLCTGLERAAADTGVAFSTNQVGAMFGFFFSNESEIRYFEQVSACNIDNFKKFFHGMLDAGVYLAPSAYEAGFVSAAHDPNIIDETIERARRVFLTL